MDERLEETTTEMHILSLLTCGAPTAHSLEKKNGGIFNMEKENQKQMSVLSKMKERLYEIAGGRAGVENIQSNPSYSAIITEARGAVESIETNFVNICYRRVLCVSQALSIVVNGLIMKLNLVGGF